MQVKVSARHGHLDELMQEQIRSRAEKLTHFFDRLTMIEVTIELRGDPKRAEVKVDAEHKHDFVAVAEHADPLMAVGEAVDRMIQQIKHYKDKVQDHRRNPSHGGESGIKP